MNTLFSFIFWVSVYFSLLGILYYFLIRPQDNPAFSRSFILGGLFVSLAAGAGFFSRTAGITANETMGLIILPEVVVYASEGLERSQVQINEYLFTRQGILYFSFAVSMLVFLRFAGSLVYLVAKWQILKGCKINGLFVIPMRGDHTPFSFFRLVFIPERLLGDSGIDQVLLHERAHVSKLHSLDLVFLELLSIFFWFHPVIWYLRREMKMQHEFEADRYVLDHEVDKASYQHLLINFSLRSYYLPITNPFNFSPLKKRVMMMNKQSKNSRTRVILTLFATLTLFGGMLLFHSISLGANEISLLQNNTLPEASGAVMPQPEFTLQSSPQPPPPPPSPPAPPTPAEQGFSDDVIFTVVENPPAYPGGEEARIGFLQNNLRYPRLGMQTGMQGTLFVTFVVTKTGKLSDIRILRSIEPSAADSDRTEDVFDNWESYGFERQPANKDAMLQEISKLFDDEVVRIMAMMPEWIPGTQRGEAVNVQYTMPVKFTLK